MNDFKIGVGIKRVTSNDDVFCERGLIREVVIFDGKEMFFEVGAKGSACLANVKRSAGLTLDLVNTGFVKFIDMIFIIDEDSSQGVFTSKGYVIMTPDL